MRCYRITRTRIRTRTRTRSSTGRLPCHWRASMVPAAHRSMTRILRRLRFPNGFRNLLKRRSPSPLPAGAWLLISLTIEPTRPSPGVEIVTIVATARWICSLHWLRRERSRKSQGQNLSRRHPSDLMSRILLMDLSPSRNWIGRRRSLQRNRLRSLKVFPERLRLQSRRSRPRLLLSRPSLTRMRAGLRKSLTKRAPKTTLVIETSLGRFLHG